MKAIEISSRYDIPVNIINESKTLDLLHDGKITSKSKIVVICKCLKDHTVQVSSVQRVLKRTGEYRCLKCGTDVFRYTPEFIEKQRQGVKNSWTPERRMEQSKISTELNSSPIRRYHLKQASSKAWENQEKRDAARYTAMKEWQDEEFLKSREVLYSSEKYRKENSLRIKEVWKRPEYRAKFETIWNSTEFSNKMSTLIREVWEDPQYQFNVSEGQKKLWLDDDHREKMAKIRSSINNSGRDSSLERVTQELLSALNIQWSRHHVIGPYEFDLFISSHNLLIECQGEYWHSLDKSKRVDSSKFTYIDKYFPDLKILYLYERDFLNPGMIKQRLVRELFEGEYGEEQIDFELSDVEIRQLPTSLKCENSFYSLPEEFLQSYHYARFGRTSKIIYGAYVNDKLISVCKFASVVRREVASSLNYSDKVVLELDRFCIHPQYQKKNFASWMISRCAKLVFEEFSYIQCLVSFADSTFGHSGTIYKASNWTEVHKTTPSYHYVSPEGFVIHKKTLYNHAVSMKKTEREYAEEFGYTKVVGKEKTKFILKRK